MDKPTTGNYTPSPIERLTTRTVEQRTLEVLERIEALLIGRTSLTVEKPAFATTTATTAVQPAQEDPQASKRKSRFSK
jgi:hypothetical protein